MEHGKECVQNIGLEIADLGEENGINLTCGDKTGVVIMEKYKK